MNIRRRFMRLFGVRFGEDTVVYYTNDIDVDRLIKKIREDRGNVSERTIDREIVKRTREDYMQFINRIIKNDMDNGYVAMTEGSIYGGKDVSFSFNMSLHKLISMLISSAGDSRIFCRFQDGELVVITNLNKKTTTTKIRKVSEKNYIDMYRLFENDLSAEAEEKAIEKLFLEGKPIRLG